MLLEHIGGENIRQIVKQAGAPPPNLVLSWMQQLSEVLDYIHSQVPPIIHRDLTPDNIVLRGGNEIVLIDFGAANQFVGDATGTLVGKQAYIAPEQFRGKATPQSDLYAFGATMFFLLTGTDPEPLSQSHPRSLNAQIDSRLDELVASCTAMEASERPKSALAILGLIKSLAEKFKSESSSRGEGN
jgi:serine/threonine-protein kinase